MDKDTIHYSSERQDDILTAMGIPWLDPSSCDPMFSMLHPASSTTPSVGLIPPSHSSTRTSSNSSSSVSTPRHVQQSDMFWQAPANGTLPIYAASVSPPNSQQMVHRRSMPEIKQPYQNNTSTSTRRQRRRTEGTVTVDDGDDEQRRQMFLERNRQAAFKCRLRKKQWLTNLQNQVEYMDTDNRQLEHQILRLREEILNLKTLIVAHKDCTIAKEHAKSMGFPLSSSSTHQQQTFNPPPSIH
ncbi:hypothetical protein LRAMOSA00320 [Lichtheimia ramosa]|uniref:BZIP domain-containing protein n=1 Tax=Lichtheimia ramosa TaxID=688394 RepID=A0A077W9Y9_9FUNG|nr:hypothetical protein LRAMOSA00320 [Lichtheimia ramosa]